MADLTGLDGLNKLTGHFHDGVMSKAGHNVFLFSVFGKARLSQSSFNDRGKVVIGYVSYTFPTNHT